MTKASNQGSLEEPLLFHLPESIPAEPKVKPLHHRIWTESKAKLIERYLYYFVMITKHGTYIDGFAGPQDPDKIESWAAKLVLESEPRWLRNFYLFDADKKQVDRLEKLKCKQPPRDVQRKEPERNIDIRKGDFNVLVTELLESGCIKQNEAAFCLLDQRTFECHWSTLAALAAYKTSGRKIELFYFLPNSWLDRALAAQKNTAILKKWWGRDDWQQLRTMRSLERVKAFASRFKKELGYWSVKPWPIFERQDGAGALMYHMIHATDHLEAPSLMSRAYEKAVLPKETEEQLMLEGIL